MPDTNIDAELGKVKTDLPLALLPVRLETRFSVDGKHLLVRIYPDDLHVNSFDQRLTKEEIVWGKHFWHERWLRGKDEAAERSVWAQLAERFRPQRAAWIARTLTPTNPEDRPEQPPPKGKLVVTPRFPDNIIERTEAWARAPYAAVLPDFWIAIGYVDDKQVFIHPTQNPVREPLLVSPALYTDADAKGPGEGPDDHWLIDFESAMQVGMGMRIPFSGDRLDRLVVLGVKTTSTGADGGKKLEDLLQAHYYTQGLSFVPQGTPTNNTFDAPSGYSSSDPGYEESFRLVCAPAAPAMSDGSNAEVTARAFGISHQIFADLKEAAATEQLDAKLMNAVLWPTTWGYFLEQMMAGPGSLSDETIREVKDHFVNYVRARGPLPALRIGNQPYGVLPVISLDHWKSLDDNPVDTHLVKFLRALHEVWVLSLANVPRITADTLDPADDSETLLLRILAMTPTSIGYALRPGQRFSLPITPTAAAHGSGNTTSKWIAEKLGLTWTPRQIQMIFASYTQVLQFTGALVEPPAGKESAAYYADLVNKPIDELRSPPTKAPLLYLLIRHALLLESAAAAFRILLLRNEVGSEDRLEKERVDDQTITPWRLLEHEMPDISPATSVGKFLVDVLKRRLRKAGYSIPDDLGVPTDMAAELGDFISFIKNLDALVDVMVKLPANRLEGLLSETLDLCSHRYDAWVTSLAAKRLKWLRRQQPLGVYLGGYGFVENLVREKTRRTVNPESLAYIHPAEGTPIQPLYTDSNNQGFMHAPSLAHATTAAILRSGYLSRRVAGDGALLAVNLTSDRVRLALWLLDGVRQGQSLSALLGYRFERALHDHHLDKYIPYFRRLAPLEVYGPLVEAGDNEWKKYVESLPANRVVDGLALLEKWKPPSGHKWMIPWGKGDLLPAQDTPAYDACVRQLVQLVDAVDAISDVVIAEAVHHVAQGNPVPAGATLEAIAEGEAPPPEIDVIRTPRTGIGITHRLGVLFEGKPETVAWGKKTIRARTEPFLNAWAAKLLGPAAANARCRIEYLDPENSAADIDAESGVEKVLAQREVTLGDLGLAPLDLVYLAEAEGEAQRSELEQRLVYYALLKPPQGGRPEGIPPSASVQLKFARASDWPPETLSMAEVLEVARAARRLITEARPLGPPDVPGRLEDEDDASPPQDPANDSLRLSARTQAAIDDFRKAHADLRAAIPPKSGDPSVPSPQIDTETVRRCLLCLADFGLAGAVPLIPAADNPDDLEVLQKQAESLCKQAESIESEARKRLGRIAELEASHREIVEKMEKTGQPIFPQAVRNYHIDRLKEVMGKDFRILPRVKLHQADDLIPFLSGSKALQGGSPLEAVTWLLRVARVRGGAARLQAALLYSEALEGDSPNIRVAQLPSSDGEPWVGYECAPSGSRLSLVMHTPTELDLTKPLAGLFIDEWVEVVPSKEETTGLTFHYNAPAARAPQAILLAVAPDDSPSWNLDRLEATVLETLELAKLRTVDLTALESVGQFLPALYFANNASGDTIAIDFSEMAGLIEKGG